MVAKKKSNTKKVTIIPEVDERLQNQIYQLQRQVADLQNAHHVSPVDVLQLSERIQKIQKDSDKYFVDIVLLKSKVGVLEGASYVSTYQDKLSDASIKTIAAVRKALRVKLKKELE